MPKVNLTKNIQYVPTTRLIPYARNARTHSDAQVAQIAGSIREFGFNNPLLVDAEYGVIAGHGRLLAARKLGLTEVPVIVLDHLTENEKRAYILADNRLAEAAGWDEEMLRTELGALADEDIDLALTGFADEDIARLLGADDPRAGMTDEDAVPEVAEQTVSRRGDLWIMGNHRLFCGDAAVAGDTERLMAADKADLVFTDPPYNVDYEGYTEDRLTIEGDRMSEAQFRHFLLGIFARYREVTKENASLYVCHASSWQCAFEEAMKLAGFEIRCQIIWAKNTFAWGFGRYKFQHEPIFYAHVAGQSDRWYGDKSQSTLWSADKPAANRLHPTMKPIELVERALMNSSLPGDVVADLFGGAGSTLIACERRDRKARLMEIDPRYCDVIVRRWQQYTGRQAVLDPARQSFSEIESIRGSVQPDDVPEQYDESRHTRIQSAELPEAA
jgi:DNA modification methylase